jgi:adenylate cyclase
MANPLQKNTLNDARSAWARRAAEEQWQMFLSGKDPALRRYRRLLKLVPGRVRCKFCNAPLSGPGAPLMRLIGRGPSKLNPTFCNICIETIPVGGAEVELTMFFADVRGSTRLAEQMRPAEFSQLINRFYVAAVEIFTRTDALVNRLIGDAVIGLYVSGLSGPDHARLAVTAGEDLLRAVGYGSPGGPWLPVGIGIHTGVSFVGKVGDQTIEDLAVLGDAANVTARLASQAGAGQILISQAAGEAARLDLASLERQVVELKGRAEPVTVYALRVVG